MRAIRRAAGPAAWVLSTAAATAVAWWAVSAVGGASEGGAVLDDAQVAAALATERASRSATPTPDADPTAGASPTATASPDPAAATVVRTWAVAGGTVSASCTGDVITLLYATPSGGWGVETKKAGPGPVVEVELDREGAETRVEATCVDGTPQPTVTSDPDDGERDPDEGEDEGEDGED